MPNIEQFKKSNTPIRYNEATGVVRDPTGHRIKAHKPETIESCYNDYTQHFIKGIQIHIIDKPDPVDIPRSIIDNIALGGGGYPEPEIFMQPNEDNRHKRYAHRSEYIRKVKIGLHDPRVADEDYFSIGYGGTAAHSYPIRRGTNARIQERISTSEERIAAELKSCEEDVAAEYVRMVRALGSTTKELDAMLENGRLAAAQAAQSAVSTDNLMKRSLDATMNTLRMLIKATGYKTIEDGRDEKDV